MTTVRLDIISIGTLARNRLWNESDNLRTAHATSSLVRAGRSVILVDPGLPALALAARLFERTGLKPSAVDTVFLTTLQSDHRAGLGLFDRATVYAHEREIDFFERAMEAERETAGGDSESQVDRDAEQALLARLKPAPDELVAGVGIFPLFGHTPGTCGLIITTPTMTTILAGDAVASIDHFLAGQVLPDARNVTEAQSAFAEVYEIADMIVPGHDNIFPNPRSQGY
jgi:glyoxylase-like metal-dependent hydrolase (beta-lactamase superfamily II)